MHAMDYEDVLVYDPYHLLQIRNFKLLPERQQKVDNLIESMSTSCVVIYLFIKIIILLFFTKYTAHAERFEKKY